MFIFQGHKYYSPLRIEKDSKRIKWRCSEKIPMKITTVN